MNAPSRTPTSTTATINDNKTAWVNAKPRHPLRILPKNAAIVTLTDTLLQKQLAGRGGKIGPLSSEPPHFGFSGYLRRVNFGRLALGGLGVSSGGLTSTNQDVRIEN